MRRKIENDLVKWKLNEARKPLLLNGMRQVGKTWILKDFGKKNYENVHYFNFDSEPTLCEFFKTTKDPDKLLKNLSLLRGVRINTEDLIIFDEIQECNEALNALKYFCESEVQYHIAGAGSYLGITLSKGASFPVGKVEIMNMYPLTYREFLEASGETMLSEYIPTITVSEGVPQPIFEKMKSLFLEFYVVGGMPEIVAEWIKTKDIERISSIQNNILNAYRSDFSKYAPREIMPKILEIWDSIISQLSRENKKFKYSEIKKSARAREYEAALNWLVSGRYFQKIAKVKIGSLPLSAHVDLSHFKIYLSDVGLLRKKADLPSSIILENTSSNIPFKGALAENVVLQELIAEYEKNIYYWADKSNQELDYIIQLHENVIPIEVKYGQNVKSSSLTRYLKTHPDQVGVRFSMKNLRLDGSVLNIPTFLVSELERLYESVK